MKKNKLQKNSLMSFLVDFALVSCFIGNMTG